jgi:hypothetical protein
MTACFGQPHIDDRDSVISSLKEEVSALLDENDRLRRDRVKLRNVLAPIAAKAGMYGQNAFVPRAVIEQAVEALNATADESV